jgi:hypothetical protein
LIWRLSPSVTQSIFLWYHESTHNQSLQPMLSSSTRWRSPSRQRCRGRLGAAGSAIRGAPPANVKSLDTREPEPSIPGTSRRRGKAGQLRACSPHRRTSAVAAVEDGPE